MSDTSAEVQRCTCGHALPPDSLFCPYCGEKVPEPKAEPRCPKCNSLLEKECAFCPRCGTKLDGSNSGGQATDDSGHNKNKGKGSGLSERQDTRFLVGIDVVQILLVLFAPWVTVNYYVGSKGINLLSFGSLASDASSTVSALESFSGTSSGMSGSLSMFATVSTVLAFLCVGLFIFDITKDLKGYTRFPRGAIATIIVQLIALVAVSGASQEMSSYMGGYASSLISISFGWWLTLIVSIVAIAFRSSYNKNQGVPWR